MVERVDLTAFSALKTVDIAPSSIVGSTVRDVTRHGKFLDIRVDAGHLVVHLARAGWIRWREDVPATPAKPGKGPLAARVVLSAPDGCLDLTEAGTKKSLALYLVHSPADVRGIARLGPDPLDDTFTLEVFSGILAAAGTSRIKGVLKDQSRIAGIGNAYSDEILHAARMSPFTPAAMPDDDVAALYSALTSTLRTAVRRLDGSGAADLKQEKKAHMQVHGRGGEQCPVCGDTVRQVVYSDSSLQYCPTCQTGGKVLADRGMSRLLK